MDGPGAKETRGCGQPRPPQARGASPGAMAASRAWVGNVWKLGVFGGHNTWAASLTRPGIRREEKGAQLKHEKFSNYIFMQYLEYQNSFKKSLNKHEISTDTQWAETRNAKPSWKGQSPLEDVFFLKCHRQSCRETHKVNGSLSKRAQVLPPTSTDSPRKPHLPSHFPEEMQILKFPFLSCLAVHLSPLCPLTACC